jgi:hypothetical protein
MIDVILMLQVACHKSFTTYLNGTLTNDIVKMVKKYLFKLFMATFNGLK